MKCPNCNNAMIVLEIDEVEIDHCLSCRGVWLDGGELELLLGDADNRDALMRSLKKHAGGRDRRIRCPICHRVADIVSYGGGDPVELDMCPLGHGLWLDDGELRDVIARGDFPEDHRIFEIINDVFGQRNES